MKCNKRDKERGRDMGVILVVLDGLSAQVGRNTLGFLSALVKEDKGHYREITCELPSMSRPLYECILTGKKPIESGIVNNDISRLSYEKSIFHYAKEAGLITAAAAYHWVSELYNRTPFNPETDRYIADINLTIPYGHFYFEDHYPDSHLFLDGEYLRKLHEPDFLFIHSMNIDDAGHKYGLDSAQYRNAARSADMHLSNYLPKWLKEGYQIIITADHGMNIDHSHGGTLPEEQEVPLFIFGSEHREWLDAKITQTDIQAMVCQMLKIAC